LAKFVSEPACEIKRAAIMSPINAPRFGATCQHDKTIKMVSVFVRVVLMKNFRVDVVPHRRESEWCMNCFNKVIQIRSVIGVS